MAGMRRAILLFAAGPDAREAAALMGVPVLEVPPEMNRAPLAVLLGHRKAAADPAVYAGDPLPESIAVYHGLEGQPLQAALSALRGKVALRALTTPTNMNWNAHVLYRHLSQEREALARR